MHIFNTYFFASLNTNVNKKTGINYDAVKRWTMKLSKENIFKYKYLVVPINEKYVTLELY